MTTAESSNGTTAPSPKITPNGFKYDFKAANALPSQGKSYVSSNNPAIRAIGSDANDSSLELPGCGYGMTVSPLTSLVALQPTLRIRELCNATRLKSMATRKFRNCILTLE